MILEGGEAIPGANPLTCQKVHDDDVLIIDKVDLNPNPPAAFVHTPKMRRHKLMWR